MDVRRYFRWPFLAVLAAVIPILIFIVVYVYASSSTGYRQAKLPYVIALINRGQVRSARLGYHVIQITTTGPRPQHLEASWAGNRGTVLARQLQQDHDSGKLRALFIAAAPGGPLSSVPGTIVEILPYALIILIVVSVLLGIRRRLRT